MLEEIEYYARTHSVVDEGFHEVMAHNEWVKAQCGELARCKQALDRLLAAGGEDAYLREERTLRIHARAGRGADEVSVACRRLAERSGGPAVGLAVCGPTVAAVLVLIRFPMVCFISFRRFIHGGGIGDGRGRRPAGKKLKLRR